MKVLVLLAGLAVLFTVTGCEGEHHHQNEGYGGSYEGPNTPPGYGQGEYRGYPNYPDYRY